MDSWRTHNGYNIERGDNDVVGMVFERARPGDREALAKHIVACLNAASLLREIEWGQGRCPSCDGERGTNHAPGCKLAAALAATVAIGDNEDGAAVYGQNVPEVPTKTTTDGNPPAPGYENASAPQPIDPATGQHGAYWVLSAEERSKGFVRPVRETYRHVGHLPRHPLRDLTPEEQRRYLSFGYVKFEAYPEDENSAAVGRYWTEADLQGGCQTVTRMGLALAETYARNPGFYGSTFCCACRKHLPVGEFVWEGTSERVGS